MKFYVSQHRTSRNFARLFQKIRYYFSTIPLKIAMAKLRGKNRYQHGKITFGSWSVEYVDASALESAIDLLLIKKINDFRTTNPAPVIIDCGANIGISVLNYKQKYPRSRITAFEPDPHIFPVLQNNITVNGASEVNCVEAAVWTSRGKSQFFCEGADGSKLINPGTSSSSIEVSTVDLRELINEPVDLIKMDIEGAEFEVIPHISDKMHLVKNFLIECHVNCDEIEKFSGLLHALGGAGFRVSISILSGWTDLLQKPVRIKNGFDQYILISAWKT
jgi:FkbM family methyltransferase